MTSPPPAEEEAQGRGIPSTRVVRPWRFNPYEIAVCGYKNCGKTTLLEAVARELSRTMGIAYLKHDAHRFVMDHPGKDTHRLTQAGAMFSIITGNTGTGRVARGGDVEILFPYDLLAADALLVEGYKHSDLPRIMLLDPELAILNDSAWTSAPPIAVAHPFQPGGVAANSAQATLVARFGEIPFFHRSDIDGLCGFMTRTWERRRPVLRGLLLTGGESLPGGANQRAQLDMGRSLLARHCVSVSVSRHPDQRDETLRGGDPLQSELFSGRGPMGSILTALGSADQPDSAWLVLAGGNPSVVDSVLAWLVKQRSPMRFATAFRGPHDRPEALCAIYEPKAFPRLLQFVGLGHACPSTCLQNSPVQWLTMPGNHSLDNMGQLP